jgi:hypothetical protein
MQSKEERQQEGEVPTFQVDALRKQDNNDNDKIYTKAGRITIEEGEWIECPSLISTVEKAVVMKTFDLSS